jgi:hypothetical protein
MGSEGRCRKRFITEFEENLLAFAFLRGIMKIGMGAMGIPIRLPGKSESKLSDDWTEGKPVWPVGPLNRKPTWPITSVCSATSAFFISLKGARRSRLDDDRKGLAMTLGTILLVVLILFLLGAFPRWEYSRNWGYGPSGGIGLVLVIVLILVLVGRI